MKFVQESIQIKHDKKVSNSSIGYFLIFDFVAFLMIFFLMLVENPSKETPANKSLKLNSSFST